MMSTTQPSESTLLVLPTPNTSSAVPSRSIARSVWNVAFSSFVLGVVLTFLLLSYNNQATWNHPNVAMPLLGSAKKHPALHYFAKASTDFAETLPLMADRDNSFLADLVTSSDSHKPITSGFYRQEKGMPLVYTYTYHEMKIIVAGEFYISDDAGQSVHATPGDVFYFPKGSTITFDSPSFGLGFFCGQRETGTA